MKTQSITEQHLLLNDQANADICTMPVVVVNARPLSTKRSKRVFGILIIYKHEYFSLPLFCINVQFVIPVHCTQIK